MSPTPTARVGAAIARLATVGRSLAALVIATAIISIVLLALGVSPDRCSPTSGAAPSAIGSPPPTPWSSPRHWSSPDLRSRSLFRARCGISAPTVNWLSARFSLERSDPRWRLASSDRDLGNDFGGRGRRRILGGLAAGYERVASQRVISTIMLNFVAAQVLSWAVHGPLMEPCDPSRKAS